MQGHLFLSTFPLQSIRFLPKNRPFLHFFFSFVLSSNLSWVIFISHFPTICGGFSFSAAETRRKRLLLAAIGSGWWENLAAEKKSHPNLSLFLNHQIIQHLAELFIPIFSLPWKRQLQKVLEFAAVTNPKIIGS